MQSGRRIYWILAMLSGAGYSWMAFQLYYSHVHEKGLSLCLIKNVTGFPCPSCGMTRSLVILVSGDLYQSVMINPLGIVAATALLVVPGWILGDVITARNSLAEFFFRAENKLRTRKTYYISGIALMLTNWGWSVMKEL